MEISIANTTQARVRGRWLTNQIKIVIRRLQRHPPISLSVVIVGRVRMRRWHKTYRGRDRVTDVLSFDFRRQTENAGLNGEIVICREEAEVVAREREINLNRAFLWLIIHGILHLAGFEHEKVSLHRANKMLSVQNQLVHYFHV